MRCVHDWEGGRLKYISITRRHCGAVCAFTQSGRAGPAEAGHTTCTPLHQQEHGAPLRRSCPHWHKAGSTSVRGGSCANMCPHFSKCHFLASLPSATQDPQHCNRARVGSITPALQPPNCSTVKIWVTQVLAQPPFFNLCISPIGFKGASWCPPSFAVRPLAAQYCFISFPSPGNHAIIVLSLTKGIQILLPQPQKTMEQQKEQKGTERSAPALKESSSCPGPELGFRASCTGPW